MKSFFLDLERERDQILSHAMAIKRDLCHQQKKLCCSLGEMIQPLHAQIHSKESDSKWMGRLIVFNPYQDWIEAGSL